MHTLLETTLSHLRPVSVVSTLTAGLLLSACAPPADGPPPALDELSEPTPTEALAVIRPTANSAASGTMRFIATLDGLRVVAELEGLDPERAHAAHIHVLGDCTAPDATSAGGHYNFAEPGTPTPEATRIVGNVGEFVPSDDGSVRDTATISDATLDGRSAIVGRSVVVHASGNEPGPPPGSQSGARVACGVIGISALTGS